MTSRSEPVLTFTPGAGDVAVDLDKLVESRLLIQANSGGGKSTAIRYLLEQTHGRIQHIVIDREGEFATLRDAYAYALIGRGGEAAPDTKTAKQLVRMLLERGISAIVDLSEMSLAQQREYVAAFISALNHLPRDLWKDCLVVIDEAHTFAPERGKSDSVAREPISLLLSTGRKRGYCAVLATQRLAKLDKDVAAECLNKMIGRTSSEDAKRAGEELAFDKAGARDLRALEPGMFWTYGPAIGTEPVLVRTGKVKTRPPKRGAQREAAPPTPAKIAAFAQEFAQLPQAAEDEASSLEQLRTENRELTRRIRQFEKAQPAPAIDQAHTDREVHRAVTAEAERHARYRKVIRNEVVGVTEQVGAIERAAAHARSLLDGILVGIDDNWIAPPAGELRPDHRTRPAPGGDHAPAGPKPATPRPAAVARAAAPAVVSEDDDAPTAVSASEQKILDALALLEEIGIDQPDRLQLAFFSGYTRGGRFNNLLGSLRTAGLIEYPGGNKVALTHQGIAQSSAEGNPIRTLADLHGLWERKLPPSEWKVLEQLLRMYPDSMSRAALATHTGYAVGGRFNNILGALRSLGAATYPRDGEVAASKLLFPEGLR